MPATLALGCDSTTTVPEPGAILLRVSVASGAPTPDELRLFVYDDGGAIWQNVRFPEQGMLTVRAGGSLGTILIQPGSTSGALRVHASGRAAGAQIDDGVLTIPASERARGTFDLVLQAAASADDDSDGVPDSIDDCVTVANPAQGGCPGGDRDGGEDARGGNGGNGVGGTIGSGGAGGETSNGGSVGTGGRGGDAVTDGGAGSGGMGQAGGSGKGGSGGRGGTGVSGSVGGGGRGGAGGSGSGGRGGNGSGGGGGTTGGAGTGGTASGGRGGTTGTGGGAGTGSGGRAGVSGCPVDGGCTLDQGDACSNAGQCRTGFCKDGVCCNSACTDDCQSCGGGTCQPVRSAEDAPECVAPMHCNGGAKCVLN